MAISWGSWDAPDGAGFRVGVETSVSAVTTNSTSVTFTTTWWVEAEYNVNDSMTLTYSGSISGSSTQNLTTGSSGGTKEWQTKSSTYTYSTYGTSPGTVTHRADLSGVYNGANPYKSVTFTIPARPYAAPTAPSSVTLTRNSDTQNVVSWTRNVTAQKPYTSLTVQRRVYDGATWSAYSTIATTTSTATSFVDSTTVANRGYQYQVRANNSVGSSSYVATAIIMNTPAAPTNVASTLNAAGTQITTTWTDNAYDEANVTYGVKRSVNGGAFANVVTGLAYNVTSWTDTTPGAGTNKYSVYAFQSGSGGLYSAEVQGNTINTIVAPLAPTLLSPTGTGRDATASIVLTWQHNHGGDSAPQSGYVVQFSSDGGSTWPISTGIVSSTAQTHTVNAGTLTNGVSYLWRVQTRGISSAGFGPFSANATLTASAKPVTNITSPGAIITTPTLTVTWTYSQAQSSPQSYWGASLYENGVALEYQEGVGTGTTANFNYVLVDGHTYVVAQQSASSAGVLSVIDNQTFEMSLLPPEPVTATAEFQPCTGTMVLHLEEAAPPAAVQYNKFINPGLQVNTTGWNATINTTGATWTPTRELTGGPAGVSDAFYRMTINTPGTGVLASTGVLISSSGSDYLPLVPGVPNAISAYCRSSVTNRTVSFIVTSHTAAGANQTVEYSGPATPVGGTDWVRFDCVVTPAAGQVRGFARLYNTDGDLLTAGETLDATGVLNQPSTSVLNPYFDGDSPWGGWDGTRGGSFSSLQAANTVPVTSANIERRIDGGEWVLLATGITLPNDVLDVLPTTHGLNEYRVTSVSASPSYLVNPTFAAAADDREWVFLAWGPGFSNVLRFRGDVGLNETSGRVRAAQHFLGREDPVLLVGENTTYAVSASGALHYDEDCVDPEADPCRFDSPPVDWREMSLRADVVCYRDYTGRRLFGLLSDVEIEDSLPGNAAVSLSVTRTYYAEATGTVA